MARILRDLGFVVIQGENLSQVEMKRRIRLFGDRLRGGGIGLFYYAGHGLQVDGRNYLIPVNAAITKEQEAEYESVDLGFVIAQMEDAHNSLNIVILDACRNNPFARSFRSTKSGLASIDAPSGTLIAYATAPGSVASDGSGKNGLYTQELLKYIRLPEVSIEQVFKKVRIAVREQTKGAQTPWESSSLVGDFYFKVPASATKPSSSPSQPIRPETYIQKGDALADQKKWAEAEDAYQTGLALEPQNPWYMFKVYTALSNQSKVDQSVAQMTMLNEIKRWDEIEAEARRLVKHIPTSASRRWELGAVLIQQKKHADAEAELRKAISLDTGAALLRNSLGIALRGQKKYAEAEAETRRAISIEPNNGRWHGSLGNTLYSQQKYAEAEAEYRKAISLDPDAAIFHGTLGDALASQKKYAEAEAEYSKASALDPDNKVYKEALDSLPKKKH
jgi:tetratricopeptide (TPR) repeat protein